LNTKKRRQIAVPGILGGMGPLAHVEFEQRLIEESFRRGATSDHDHPVWVLVNAADIPDRSSSLAGCAAPCVSSLIRYGNRLRDAGADFMVVPCNTAHAFYEEVWPNVAIPWLNLVEAVTKFVAGLRPKVMRIGVVATDGTLLAEVYRNSLRNAGLEPIEPALGSLVQLELMKAIYHATWGVKAGGANEFGQARRALDDGIGWLKENGAEVVIAGCTEFSVLLRNGPEPVLPWIDPLAILARTVLDAAYESDDDFESAAAIGAMP
jgi:aspartate racemase